MCGRLSHATADSAWLSKQLKNVVRHIVFCVLLPTTPWLPKQLENGLKAPTEVSTLIHTVGYEWLKIHWREEFHLDLSSTEQQLKPGQLHTLEFSTPPQLAHSRSPTFKLSTISRARASQPSRLIGRFFYIYIYIFVSDGWERQERDQATRRERIASETAEQRETCLCTRRVRDQAWRSTQAREARLNKLRTTNKQRQAIEIAEETESRLRQVRESQQ